MSRHNPDLTATRMQLRKSRRQGGLLPSTPFFEQQFYTETRNEKQKRNWKQQGQEGQSPPLVRARIDKGFRFGLLLQQQKARIVILISNSLKKQTSLKQKRTIFDSTLPDRYDSHEATKLQRPQQPEKKFSLCSKAIRSRRPVDRQPSVKQFLNIESITPKARDVKRLIATASHSLSKEVQPKLRQTYEVQETPIPRQVKAVTGLSEGKMKAIRARSTESKTVEYRDLLWKVCFSFGMESPPSKELGKPFRVYIGRGNNSRLVRSLFNNRWWWATTNVYDADVNLVWTQLRYPEVFSKQKRGPQSRPAFPAQMGQMECGSVSKERMLLNDFKFRQWQLYFKKHYRLDYKHEDLRSRKALTSGCQLLDRDKMAVSNHLEQNYFVGNKKALFFTLSSYCRLAGKNVFDYVPLTFHLKSGTEDPEYGRFVAAFQARARESRRGLGPNLWIVKPGELTNRGNGIQVCEKLDQIKCIVKTKELHPNGRLKTYIVQQYITKPLLYHRRKFDIRHYILVSSFCGSIKAYWYKEGYVRTSCREFSLLDMKGAIHLTNDAVQKQLPDYGKYERGNKLSYLQFQAYLGKEHGTNKMFQKQILPRMKLMATQTVRASFKKVDPSRLCHNFELFGLDFMLDEDFRPWLIEVNSNPCLELSCPHLTKLIPAMLENVFKIAVDPLFPPPLAWPPNRKPPPPDLFEQNRFELIFDEQAEQAQYDFVEECTPDQMHDPEEEEEFDESDED